MAKKRSPNENEANAKNPNNSAYRTLINNRANQLNPNNPCYLGRSKKN